MKYSGIGGQAVIEGVMMKTGMSMPPQSVSRTERLKLKRIRLSAWVRR